MSLNRIPQETPADEDGFWAVYTARYGPDLAKDGAGARYNESWPRALSVLQDPDNSGTDLRQDFLSGGAKYQIWHRLAEWAAGILAGFPPYDEVYGNTALKNDRLSRIAVANLKQRSGGSSIDDGILNRFAFKDRALLRQQIQSLDPTVMLAGGRFDQLIWLLGDLVSDDADLVREHSAIMLTNGAVLVRWVHPACRSAARESCHMLKSIFSALPEGELGRARASVASAAEWFS